MTVGCAIASFEGKRTVNSAHFNLRSQNIFLSYYFTKNAIAFLGKRKAIDINL
ncbi:hypothetical protein [Spirulina sp. 06S082]|uniref:hypothetical protein n=1 Tax=Spirulina sp. 06S082 TaxID=3110248 RepID=UPI002B1EBAE3|nr:hypothetical protein [Spirulina sp. 06S082]MEA5468016.1 hypothetical protein [Spirulina sp. 06S082]